MLFTPRPESPLTHSENRLRQKSDILPFIPVAKTLRNEDAVWYARFPFSGLIPGESVIKRKLFPMLASVAVFGILSGLLWLQADTLD